MRNQGRFIRALLASGLLFGTLAATCAQAATIGLTVHYPDLILSSGSLSYSYTAICQKPDGSNQGSCMGSRTVPRWDLTYGRLTITGNALTLNPDGTGAIAVTDVNGSALNYSLTVILGFNSTGTAVSGILATDPWSEDSVYTSALAAYGTTSNTNFHSGTLVTGTPTSAVPYSYLYAYGWGGQNRTGIFEFVANNIGGDFGAFGNHPGIIASTTNLTHPLLTTSPPVETWDSNGVDFWKNNFSATVDVHTVVPIPAAVWLFGSGLASLGWIKRRSIVTS